MPQNAPFKKTLRESMPPNPPSKRLVTPHVTSSFASCNSPSPQNVPPSLGKSYILPWTILLRNLFEEMRARRIHAGRQFVVCSTLYVYALQHFLGGKND